MTPLRLGILGSGFMGQTHAAAAAQLPDVLVTAIACGSRAARLAAQYKVDHEPSVASLVERPDVDAVVIATPHFTHHDNALAAIRAGKAVLIEKPMATTLADCQSILAASQQTGVAVAVGYHQRFRKNVAEARKLMRSGAIGNVLTVQVSMPMYFSRTDNAFGGKWDWWGDPRSVGHILNSGPHAIDLLRWFLSCEIQEVVAYCRSSDSSAETESTTLALLVMESGAIVSLYSSNALPCAPFPGEEFRFRIVGSEGLMDLDPFGELRIGTADGWRVASRQPPVDQGSNAFAEARIQAYRQQIQAFAARINGDQSECGTVEDGLAGVSVCLAMLGSSTERRLFGRSKDGSYHHL